MANNTEIARWHVGGDDILQKWHVVAKALTGGKSAHEWVMDGDIVKYFKSREAAQKIADSLNKREQRIKNL